ncbi:MAG: threonine synthase [Saprospiraceae bacterium]|nr:MAG: threonine synthase [Saprospiraceae bacterium]
MQLYSTRNRNNLVSLKEAVLKGLPEDNGLYMPVRFPELEKSFIQNLHQYTFAEIGFEICSQLFNGAIPEHDLRNIIDQAISFPAPLVQLDEQKYILELFHGPSLAFKDFGARFMAQLMSYFNRGENQELVILVATSGDTGGAVAAGFHQAPGIKVVILYPSGKVSMLQEKQLTTLGHNVTALEIDGTFDDCQALVKQAFLDSELKENIRLSSANSINIARLIPQSFYYFEAYKQLAKDGNPVVFCVPSGNFGNLTAGLIAQKMGLPIQHFIAATNANDVVPEYLSSGQFTPRPSVRTLSNAMDVGNPSNFARLLDLYKNSKSSTWNIMKHSISSFHFSDSETEFGLKEVSDKYNYTIDPHGAVGYLALKEYQKTNKNTRGIILETAHPSKFNDDVERILGHKIEIPERLAKLAKLKKEAISIPNAYPVFKDWLLKQY